MRPIALPAVDPAARLAASPLGRALADPTLHARAASAWARLLECPAEIAALPPTATRWSGPPRARAGYLLADGQPGVLAVDAALLAGQVGRLAGAPAQVIGPAPLSPAESGIFAYLALAWLALLDPPPALDWVDGGAALWNPPHAAAAIRWRLTLDGVAGLVHWWLPCEIALRHDAPLRPDLPLTAQLSAGRAGLGRSPRPGDLVVLHAAPRLQIGPILHPLVRRDARWIVAAAEESRMSRPIADLPLTVDAVVGRVTLTVAEASALAPGVVLPLGPDPLPEVWLVVGDQPIAAGVLVDDAGQAAVQITRLLGQSSSRT